MGEIFPGSILFFVAFPLHGAYQVQLRLGLGIGLEFGPGTFEIRRMCLGFLPLHFSRE